MLAKNKKVLSSLQEIILEQSQEIHKLKQLNGKQNRVARLIKKLQDIEQTIPNNCNVIHAFKFDIGNVH